MADLNIDTSKLRESGEDIIKLANELDEQFDALFSRISNMSSKTLEWVGQSANDYIRRSNIEKTQYNKLVNTLKKYGKTLRATANDYENKINKLGVEI